MVRDELVRAADRGFSEDEVGRVKAQLKMGLLAGLESGGASAEQLARQILIHGRPLTTQELIDKVEAVTPADAQRMPNGCSFPRLASPRLGLLFMLQNSTPSRQNSRWRRARRREEH